MTQLANRAQQLLSFMQNSKPTQDKMDIIFLAEVLQRLLKQVEHDDEVRKQDINHLQSQKAVTAYLTSKQLLSFGSAEHKLG